DWHTSCLLHSPRQKVPPGRKQPLRAFPRAESEACTSAKTFAQSENGTRRSDQRRESPHRPTPERFPPKIRVAWPKTPFPRRSRGSLRSKACAAALRRLLATAETS